MIQFVVTGPVLPSPSSFSHLCLNLFSWGFSCISVHYDFVWSVLQLNLELEKALKYLIQPLPLTDEKNHIWKTHRRLSEEKNYENKKLKKKILPSFITADLGSEWLACLVAKVSWSGECKVSKVVLWHSGFSDYQYNLFFFQRTLVFYYNIWSVRRSF